MSITVLPTPNLSRRFCVTQLDSLNRLLACEAIYNNATHNYDTTHGTTLERYDPSTNSWTTLAEVSPPIQTFGACIDSADHLYRVGGQDLLGGTGDKVNVYNSSTNTWSALANLPTPPSTPPAAWIDSLGVLRVAGATGTTTGILWEFSGGAWVTRAAAPNPQLFQGASVFVDSSNKAYLFGTTFTSDRATAVVQIYDPAANTWASTTAPFRLSYGTVYFDSVNGVFYGARASSSTTVTLCKYTIATNTWTSLATLTIPAAVTFTNIGGWVYDARTNACYCLGVISASLSGTSDLNIYKYDVATDTWSATGDFLSAARFPGGVTKIQFDGTGYYIPQGAMFAPPGVQDAVNVFEYFVPGGGGATRRARTWAAVIG